MPEGFDPKNQEENTQKLSEKSKILRAKREKLFENVLKDKQRLRGLWNDIAQYGDYIKEKYPNYREWQVYHDIAGSTDAGKIKEDFPGDDSVEVFLSRMEDKYYI